MALLLSLTLIVLCIFYEVDAFVIIDTIDGLKYYVEVTKKVNWHEAMRICGYNQMYLVDIRTSLEHDRIATYVYEANAKIQEYVLRFWTSGSDLAYKLQWSWATTGERIVWTNWHANEPNNEDGNEHCITVEWRNKTSVPSVQWNDFDCTKTAYFVCRHKLDIPLRLNTNWDTKTTA